MTTNPKVFRKMFIILLFALGNGACESPSPPSSPVSFGEGNAILESVMIPALADHGMEFEGMDWSGGGDRGSFAVHGSLFVKDATAAGLSEELAAEWKKLPAARGWKSHKFRTGGSMLLGIEYEEKGNRFYFDIVLCEKGADVEMMILHKGIRL